MAFTLPAAPRDRLERVIALARVLLASTSLFAIWLEPVEPQYHVELTYSLHVLYVVYASLLAAFMWWRDISSRTLVAIHLIDIGVGAVFQYLTLGPSSPFFMYFTFALASAAARWGSRATLRTAALVLATYIVMGLSLSHALSDEEFEANRFIIRIAYLTMMATVLVYLARHEEQLRAEMAMLARWPAVDARHPERTIARVLMHAAGIVQARRAVLIWSRDDEPWLYASAHPADERATARLAPDAMEPPVAEAIAGGPFACAGPFDDATVVITSREGRVVTWTGRPIHDELARRIDGQTIGAAPFRTEHVAGWVVFADAMVSGRDALPLVEVIGREVGASLDQVIAYERGRALAVIDDRTARARDLHDGILQSLTGVRLELQALAAGREPVDAARLLVLERALAAEQRELRQVIEPQRRPSPPATAGDSLAARLEEIGRRMTSEWRAPIAIRVSPPELVTPDRITHAVALLTHEAIANALKHAQPSRVSVDVRTDGTTLVVEVADDGRGFPFLGRRTHEELAASGTGPVSLRERVATLGGRLAVDSTSTGSRVALTVPLEVAHAG